MSNWARQSFLITNDIGGDIRSQFVDFPQNVILEKFTTRRAKPSQPLPGVSLRECEAARRLILDEKGGCRRAGLWALDMHSCLILVHGDLLYAHGIHTGWI